MQNRNKLINHERSRSMVYSHLADAYRLPGPDLPDVIDELGSSLCRMGSNAFKTTADLMQSDLNDSSSCSLAVDYTGLFIGPFMVPAPPYGSVYLDNNRQLMGDSTMDVRHHYLDLGLDLSPDFKDAPDHICAELEFMHVLIVLGVEAIQAQDPVLLSESIRRQGVFLSHHLAVWIPAFTARIIDHARTDYYRHLARLTRTFVAEESERLAELGMMQPEPAEADDSFA